MVTFLFWNLDKRPLLDCVVRLASTHVVDVLMLAECAIDPVAILAGLNSSSEKSYTFPPSAGRKSHIFLKLLESSLFDAFNNPLSGLTIRQLKLGDSQGLLLAVVHFPSRVHWDRQDQELVAPRMAKDLSRTEDRFGHCRTILVGDFNMNPFDLGIVGATALNAVMTQSLARKMERTVIGEAYRFFYNPMWGLFGDRTKGPPGTYYFSSSNPSNLFWNIYDQVLLRPALMDKLESLEILKSDGQDCFLSKQGRPRVSDHLPILFRMNI